MAKIWGSNAATSTSCCHEGAHLRDNLLVAIVLELYRLLRAFCRARAAPMTQSGIDLRNPLFVDKRDVIGTRPDADETGGTLFCIDPGHDAPHLHLVLGENR